MRGIPPFLLGVFLIKSFLYIIRKMVQNVSFSNIIYFTHQNKKKIKKKKKEEMIQNVSYAKSQLRAHRMVSFKYQNYSIINAGILVSTIFFVHYQNCSFFI